MRTFSSNPFSALAGKKVNSRSRPHYGTVVELAQKGVTVFRNPLIYSVAWPGFEPGTFGDGYWERAQKSQIRERQGDRVRPKGKRHIARVDNVPLFRTAAEILPE